MEPEKRMAKRQGSIPCLFLPISYWPPPEVVELTTPIRLLIT